MKLVGGHSSTGERGQQMSNGSQIKFRKGDVARIDEDHERKGRALPHIKGLSPVDWLLMIFADCRWLKERERQFPTSCRSLGQRQTRAARGCELHQKS